MSRPAWIPAEVRGIYFDAVGTILRPHPSAAEVYATVAARHGITVTAAELALRFRQAFRHQESIDVTQHWRTDEAREVSRWRAIVQSCLPGSSEAVFHDLYAYFGTPAAWAVLDHLPDLLREMTRLGYQLGVASNFDDRLNHVLTGLPELRSLTEHVVISSLVGMRKPGAEFFQAAAQRMNLRPDQLLLIGDDRVNDYDGATAAGWHVILIDPDDKHPDVPTRIRSWKCLLEQIR